MKLTAEKFLEFELKNGIGPHNPKFVALAEKTADQLQEYKNLSVIDYGAGTGVYSNVLLQKGFNVVAVDVDKVHRDFMKEKYPDLKVYMRPKESELMLFIEVAEHMTDEEIEKAIQKIHPAYIMFSSTSQKTKNDEEWGHINIKQQDEWLEFWINLGYKKKRDLRYPTQWSMLLEKI